MKKLQKPPLCFFLRNSSVITKAFRVFISEELSCYHYNYPMTFMQRLGTFSFASVICQHKSCFLQGGFEYVNKMNNVQNHVWSKKWLLFYTLASFIATLYVSAPLGNKCASFFDTYHNSSFFLVVVDSCNLVFLC